MKLLERSKQKSNMDVLSEMCVLDLNQIDYTVSGVLAVLMVLQAPGQPPFSLDAMKPPKINKRLLLGSPSSASSGFGSP